MPRLFSVWSGQLGNHFERSLTPTPKRAGQSCTAASPGHPDNHSTVPQLRESQSSWHNMMCGFSPGGHESYSAKLGGRRFPIQRPEVRQWRPWRPIAGRRPCRWRPSWWGGSARPAKTSTKPTPQVPFVRRISQLLETPVPLLSQFPERKGGAPLFPEIFGYHSQVLGRK